MLHKTERGAVKGIKNCLKKGVDTYISVFLHKDQRRQYNFHIEAPDIPAQMPDGFIRQGYTTVKSSIKTDANRDDNRYLPHLRLTIPGGKVWIGGGIGMKMAFLCILCELCTIAGIIYALVCGAGLQEILAGVLILLAASLLLIWGGSRRA